ncbi:MAG: DUF58 domain-containing protein [Pirellulales bacterium]
MNPALWLFVPIALFVALAYWMRAFPHRPLVYWALLPAALSLVMIFVPGAYEAVGVWPVVLLDSAVVLIAAVDFFSLSHRKHFSVARQCGRIASLGKSHRVELTVTNHTGRDKMLWIRDDVDEDLSPDPDEFIIILKARSRTSMHYDLRPRQRGAYRMERVYLRVRSRFGLWQRFLEYPAASELNVYPDMKQLSEYAILARTNRLSQMGVRRTRKIGQDNEFERMRDYTLDDNYKHIDWRATARRNKLTVKDFQANQSQRIIFLVDCGRMMTNESAGISLLDHALNSMLMLSYVALRQGDSVGAICFSDRVSNFVPPRGGLNQMNHLLHASYDRFPELVESRYDQAFLYLSAHCRKRALVVLITNVIDEVNSHQIEQYLGSLVGRHLPLGVMLRDHRLFDVAEVAQPVGSMLYQAGASAEIIGWREQVIRDLKNRGVLALDVFPEEMTAPMINSYLNIKARHLL